VLKATGELEFGGEELTSNVRWLVKARHQEAAGATSLKRSNIILMTSGGRSFMESLVSFLGVVGRAGGARRRGDERDLALVYCQQVFQYI